MIETIKNKLKKEFEKADLFEICMGFTFACIGVFVLVGTVLMIIGGIIGCVQSFL